MVTLRPGCVRWDDGRYRPVVFEVGGGVYSSRSITCMDADVAVQVAQDAIIGEEFRAWRFHALREVAT